jgi:hypothetical protein
VAVLGGVLSHEARVARACLALTLVGVLGSILVWGPEGLPLPACVFREITGLSCLACGLTRSLQAASHGHLEAAFQLHLMGPFVLVGMIILVLACVAEASTGKRLVQFRSAREQRYVFLAVVAVWVVYGVIRAIVELA